MSIDQLFFGRELHFHFDLLETAIVSHQDFAAEIYIAAVNIFQAEVIIQVHAAFDDLAAALAFDLEYIITFFMLLGPAEEVFEEAHVVFLTMDDGRQTIP